MDLDLAAFSRVANLLRGVLTYPDKSYTVCTVALVEEISELPVSDNVISGLAEFTAWVAQQRKKDLEEAFTQTFDLNPKCSLEIGWHVFGEDYDRGQFMATVRGKLREFGIEERIELPDHLTHILPLVAVLPEADADEFITFRVLVAVEKMIQSLERIKSPYLPVMRTVEEVLKLRTTGAHEVEPMSNPNIPGGK